MFIVHVHVSVKSDYVEEFKKVSVKNAQASVQEPGIVRFDVIQSIEDPSKFVLVEVYREKEDTVRHKETAHYNEWREKVVDMMAEPRSGIKYENIFPGDEKW